MKTREALQRAQDAMRARQQKELNSQLTKGAAAFLGEDAALGTANSGHVIMSGYW